MPGIVPLIIGIIPPIGIWGIIPGIMPLIMGIIPPIIGIKPGIMLPIMGIAAELVICPSLICMSGVRQRFRCVEDKDEPGMAPQQRISMRRPLLSSNKLEVEMIDRTNRCFIGGASALVDNLGSPEPAWHAPNHAGVGRSRRGAG
jgi:hypothetical protein